MGTWVFDLDNTLYAPHFRLFDQIAVRMTRFVMDTLGVDEAEANRLRTQYWSEHGTTLAGLMRVHGMDPEAYLIEVHDIDMSALTPDADLRTRITALPGRKIIFTNGTAPYAERVAAARGLDAATAAMFEDDPRNLAQPHAMGLRTVHVAPSRVEAVHIHHHTDDLAGFLARLV